MFTSLGLFKGLPCPGGSDCSLGLCLFSHDPSIKKNEHKYKEHSRHTERSNHSTIVDLTSETVEDKTTETPKKASLESLDDQNESRNSSRQEPMQESKTKTQTPRTPATTPKATSIAITKIETPDKVIPATRSLPKDTFSTPKTQNEAYGLKSKTTSSQSPKLELLQPRTLANPPAALPVRFKLLILLHEQMERLNKLALASPDPSTKRLHASKQELITTALDEEQNTAITNPKVYANVMKNRIGILKKADLKAWAVERKAAVQNQAQTPEPTAKKRKFTEANKRVTSGLSSGQEVQVLNELISTKTALRVHGYVIEVPSDTEIAKSEAGVKASNAWEQCDRCGCRFQAFPVRRESDGAITTGGSCRHHWGRLIAGPRNSNAKPIYTCCQQEQGKPGCEEKPTHVFKVSSPFRLASVLQFEETPSSEDIDLCQPLCFDCEMAYTSFGMELVRLTATAWPAGTPLLDVLVRPRGEVLDLNTRFSGVTIQQWTQAEPWSSFDIPIPIQPDDPKRLKPASTSDATATKPESIPIPIVPSIQHARNLFFKLISPSTPLIGHALENDLIALRIVHPTIVDTVILYPHKRGLPMKNKLKFLVRDEIDWTIQDNDVEGHDSLEDALAAGELVRHKVGLKWAVLQRNGWRFEGNRLCKPKSKS